MVALFIVAALAQAAPPPVIRQQAAQGPVLVAEEVFPATVLAIDDGDSVVVKTTTEQVPVRVDGVDAPEMAQPGGPEAKAFLSSLLLGKTVTVRVKNHRERSARLEVDGADVSATLIRSGMAWHCPRFTNDTVLTSAEAEARAAKRGLWSAARPTPPWLYRGAGACWQEEKGTRSKARERPDFSGTWTAISPPDHVGQQVRIRQDTATLTIERHTPQGASSEVFNLEGPTSRAFSTAHGPVDIVAKSRWHGNALIVDERRWMVRGEEALNVRQVLWLDDRGLLNLEVSTPRPIGETDATTLVLRKVSPPRD
jgi:endonuclease YncB( thermonuclease family)